MSQKRINKRQQELLVDQMVQNMTLARGNTAEPDVKEFWTNLAVKLNALGCSRNVREWQHVWQMWVQKVRAKARKVRDSVTGTGGGPAAPPLTDQENKILQVTGRAAVFGFTSQETPLRPVQDEESARRNAPSASPRADIIEDPWTPLYAPVASPPDRAVRSPSAESDREAVPRATPVPVPEVNRMPRRRTVRRPCRGQPAVTEVYLERLQQNCNALREAIIESANSIAAALLESATIIADALGSK